jgi:hypothetical protein
MNEPLRPQSLSEILDRTVQLYRSRFLVFLGIAVIPMGVIVVPACIAAAVALWWNAAGAGSVGQATAGILGGIFLVLAVLVALPVFLAATALGMAAMTWAAARENMGERVTIRAAYKHAWRRGWSYFGLYALQALFVWIAPGVVWIVLTFFSAGAMVLLQKAGVIGDNSALLGFMTILTVGALLVYAIWMQLRLCLALPACVEERMGVWASLVRSSSLGKGTKRRIFLLYLLGMALNYIVMLAIMVPTIIVISLLHHSGAPREAQSEGSVTLIAMYAASFLVQVCLKPVYGIALVLFYYDQRIRNEGYDIEVLMKRAGLEAHAQSQPELKPWMPAVPRAAHEAAPSEAPPSATESTSPGTGDPV